MDVDDYIDQMKKIYDLILSFIDDSESDDALLEILLDIIKGQKIDEKREELEHFLGIIINIANNHHRIPGFFNKIEKLIK